MLAHICLCIMLMTMISLNTVNSIPVSAANLDNQNKQLSDPFMLEPYGIGSNHFLNGGLYDDDRIDEDEILPEKRQYKKKWAKFFQGAQSPYTIAFPALIRTRRWIQEEQ
ncbi:unnamed protein product [Rotaria sp. Silwood1]|nr:unnamed protein product [Rotaria sp. Silwood1]CAF3619756.1 unnamed protein product [Rotaria sp. Silwood1]CAF3656461.1 unnamed protein product [Rotaria sp. Silwood1]CAF4622625.1 unnamed protein product [Rotaria sp. Silwood1]CAF4854588.1 unnamed protein product [Rotaria sp. Silwood1]